jgi:hypothetical protein
MGSRLNSTNGTHVEITKAKLMVALSGQELGIVLEWSQSPCVNIKSSLPLVFGNHTPYVPE